MRDKNEKKFLFSLERIADWYGCGAKLKIIESSWFVHLADRFAQASEQHNKYDANLWRKSYAHGAPNSQFSHPPELTKDNKYFNRKAAIIPSSIVLSSSAKKASKDKNIPSYILSKEFSS